MAEALLELVLHNLYSIVEKEVASFWGIGREVEKLSGTLTAIQAVLKDAEEKQLKSHAIKDWLRKLTDAAYVLDDILDECSIQSTRLGQEGESSGSSNKVHTKSISSLNPNNILFRKKISKRIRDINERLDKIAEERQKFHLREGIIERRPEVAEWRQTMSIINEPQVYGRDEDREKIVELLVGHASTCDDLSMYPIVGTGGVGKTTIAQWVFNDERVKEYFDLKIWIHVSQDFGISTIMESIIESALGQYNKLSNSDASEKQFASSKSFKGMDIDPAQKQCITQSVLRQNYKTLESMQNVVQTLLQNKRYLLVLDDVWNESKELWVNLKSVLQCGLKGSSILLTTRLVKTANIMGTVEEAHHLSNLSEDHCWSLFRQHAFGPDREEKLELVAIGREIVRKCGGLPLEAKVLGSLVRFKNEEKEWLYVKESKLWDLQENQSSILPALTLSYFNLKLQLKRCFAFCAIFPIKDEIMKEQLIHLWMANGFISSSRNLEVEDVGEEVWKELHERSFFQDVKVDEFGNTISFKMHDLFHDLARHVMGKECVVTEAESLTNYSRSIHHIGCSGSSHPFNMGTFKKTESLRTFFDFNPQVEDCCGLPKFGSLRVLRTSSSYLSSIKNLIHLRYLDIYCSAITTLPESICSLRKLQTLKLESCPLLVSLPKHLTRLQDLRHVVIRDCRNLFRIPPNIGKLRCLKSLSIFIVRSQTGYHLAELRDLQLGGKLHIEGLENVPSGSDAKEANLIGKKDLHHLYLSWSNNGKGQTTDTHEQVLEALQPHSNIKSLGIRSYKGLHLPNWMRNTSLVRSVVAIKLYNCRNCQQLPPFGKLPFLVNLYISRMEDVRHIDDDSYDSVVERAFPSLKTLTLRKLPNLERMLKDEGVVDILPRLSKLRVSQVPKLMLPCLPSVEEVQVKGFNPSFLEGMLRNLHHLKTLQISKLFELEVLPTEFSRLNALEDLDISYCDELESFPEQVLQGLNSLRTLRIACCKKFRSLSEGFAHLTSLEKLAIHSCPKLVTLPNDLSQLTSLREVEIWGSDRTSKLPEGLQCIPSLQFLTLSDFSNLASLPECLGDLTTLQTLHINNCPKLRSVPSSFLRLRNLPFIYIYDCPKLEKLCKKPNWEKIVVRVESRLTYYDNLRFLWKFGSLVIWKLRYDDFGDDSDEIADGF